MLGRPKDARPTKAPDMSEALHYVEQLHSYGAEIVVLRRGAQGVVISSKNGALRVPACGETKVVDVTGCGNAMIGGLVRVLQERMELRYAREKEANPGLNGAFKKCDFSEEDLKLAAVYG